MSFLAYPILMLVTLAQTTDDTRIGVIVPTDMWYTTLVYGDRGIVDQTTFRVKASSSARQVTWDTGSRMDVLLAQREDAWRGRTYDFVWACAVSEWSDPSTVRRRLDSAAVMVRDVDMRRFLVTY